MTIIDNALSGAAAAQIALVTTSQNVANVMTPGYTRQGVNLASVQPLLAGTKSPGSGVAVQAIVRFSDAYKSQQLWKSASDLGQHNTAQPYMTQLEQVMSDDTSGINSGLDDFFSALNAASVDPTSTPLRQQVITSADALAQRFNSLNQVLSNQRSAVGQQRQATVQQVNSLSAQIAETKAASVALFRRDGAALRKMQETSPAFFAQLDRAVRVPILVGAGAVLIMRGETVLGALAVSGGLAPGQDDECAEAALAVLAP